jgi:hypothetical protein
MLTKSQQERKIQNGGGPKTAEGKKRSSLNALKHGLTAKSPQAKKVIEDRCKSNLDSTYRYLDMKFNPKSADEKRLVEKMARCLYNYVRAKAMLRAMLKKNPRWPRYSPAYLRITGYIVKQEDGFNRARAILRELNKLRGLKPLKTNSKRRN